MSIGVSSPVTGTAFITVNTSFVLMSVSLLSKPSAMETERTSSSVAVKISFTATGTSFSPVIVRVTVAVSVKFPEAMV